MGSRYDSPWTSFVAVAAGPFGYTLSTASQRDTLSCDNTAPADATSLSYNAKYQLEVTSRNAQYSSREHFERDMFVFTFASKKAEVRNS